MDAGIAQPEPDRMIPAAEDAQARPHPLRAFGYLIWLSWQRQARAHLMVWIALGLLALTSFIVLINTQRGRWSMTYWRSPPRSGPTYAQHLEPLQAVGHLPWDPSTTAVQQLAWG